MDNLGHPEALSEAEAAYFKSGGADVDGVVKEYSGGGSNGASEPAAVSDVPAPAAPAAPAGDDDEDGAIVIGADGRAHDKLTGKYVPHAAMHRERERRKTVETELSSMREKLARGDERLAVLTELLSNGDATPGKAAGKAAPGAEVDPLEEEPIDAEEDVFGALKQAQRQNQALLKRMREGQAVQQQREASQGIASTYRSDAVAFSKATPDFADAYNHLVGGMHKELEAMGVSDPQQRNKMIADQEKNFVQQAIEQKKSPAAMLYEVAKVRGYAKKAAAQAPAAPAAPTVDAAAVAKLDGINRGQQAVVTLAGAGGANGGDALTLETLSNMSEAEFKAISDRLGKHKMRALMGG